MEIAPSLTLRRIRPDRNERRFYRLGVATDLFGTILLLRNWGRIGTDGRQRADVFPSTWEAQAAMARIAERKRLRGYTETPAKSQ